LSDTFLSFLAILDVGTNSRMDYNDEAEDVFLDGPVSENIMMSPLCCGLLRAAVDSLCLAG
jgi:hypothetical protein